MDTYDQPARYRKRPEYIPTTEEIYKMAYSAGSARNKAMVLALYTSDLRRKDPLEKKGLVAFDI